jgi:indole-3-glycerol phosphate synthase
MDILTQIIDQKKIRVDEAKKLISPAQMQHLAENSMHEIRGFKNALANRHQNSQTALIAEVKRASPSRGMIREDFHPATIAVNYERAGAACISVLTESDNFQGCDEYLTQAREAVNIPILRKDFIFDPYQIYEARYIGADAVLLIVAALSAQEIVNLSETARHLGLDVLIEVHDEQELEIALSAQNNSTHWIIGVNNRNLKTLEIDLNTSKRLKQMLPAGALMVCESGIKSSDDINAMKNMGINCFLVGESLMSQPNIYQATKDLIG